MQLLIVLWMTRRITDDIPGWGSLFHGLVGDGSVSVSIVFSSYMTHHTKNCSDQLMKENQNVGYGGCFIVHNPKHEARGGEADELE